MKHRRLIVIPRITACFLALLLACIHVPSILFPSRRHEQSTTRVMFLKYEASALEMDWNASIHAVRTSWPRLGCPKVMKQSHEMMDWLMLADSHIDTKAFNTTQRLQREEAVSYHAFSIGGLLTKIPIEPLVGTLRHPDTACASPGSFHKRDWIIFPPASLVQLSKRRILLYESDRAAAEWLDAKFSMLLGLPFHRILPWNNGSALVHVTEKDYVVAHLDSFVSCQHHESLLDEVFVDHRTLGSPMLQVWGPSAARSSQDITATYSALALLRSRGVRAHAAWA